MSGKPQEISFLLISPQGHSGFAASCSCQTPWLWPTQLRAELVGTGQPAHVPGSWGRPPSVPPLLLQLPSPAVGATTLSPGVKNGHGEGRWTFSTTAASAPMAGGAGFAWEREDRGSESRSHQCCSSLYCCVEEITNFNARPGVITVFCQLRKSPQIAGDCIIGLEMKK